mgnify:CR=1 FL=1
MSIFGRKSNVITYTVNKAVNTSMYITVQNGEVVVNAPWYFTANKIQQIVQEKKNWILSKMQECDENLSNMQSVKIFGKNYDIQVNYEKIKTPELNLKENYKIQIILPIKYRKVGNEQVLKMSIEKMYEQIAENEIEDIMEKTRKTLGFAPEDYEVKVINGKIAKCEDGKITINPELMKYKRKTIEYIVAHEFCHLKYKSHGKRFYQLIEKYIDRHSRLGGNAKDHLIDSGNEVKTPGMMASAFSWFSTELKLNLNDDNSKIAKLLIDGCSMGIKTLGERANTLNRADKSADALARKIIKTEEEMIRELESFL